MVLSAKIEITGNHNACNGPVRDGRPPRNCGSLIDTCHRGTAGSDQPICPKCAPYVELPDRFVFASPEQHCLFMMPPEDNTRDLAWAAYCPFHP